MDLSNLPKLKSQELSESSLYSYIHQYIQSLERDARLDMIEGINEKTRKRFKNPKLLYSNCAKICKHAFVAWCRSILISLALITPLPAENASVQAPSTVAAGSEPGLLLYDVLSFCFGSMLSRSIPHCL
ncbi:calcineurin-binding protein 1-like [Magnolia sinica]|uniref:calcineurin-binding protein 1-like n=1 Tax=Magnolia sinica TaxID=86752 RepID=UPI00265926D5|nr:calcineurin-binding protein 1-like [Magnolia sinica]